MKSKIFLYIFLCAISFSYSQQIICNYPFATNTQDISPNNYAATLIGNANILNGALNTGYNTVDYVSINPKVLDSVGDFSVSYKIKFNSLNTNGSYPTNNIFASSNYSQMDIFAMSFNNSWNAWVGVINGVGFNFTPKSKVVANQWYCVVLTREVSSLKIYIDGSLLGVFTCSSAPLLINSIIIGQEEDCYQGCFALNQSLNGSIKDLKIFDGALNINQVNENCCSINFSQPTTVKSNLGSQVSINIGNTNSKLKYQWQTDFGLGFQNLININQYSKVDSSALLVSNLQLKNHNQQFRCIINYTNCTDTSNVANIHITDTCINSITKYDTIVKTVYDTIKVTYYDTIVTRITSIKAQKENQTQLMIYPNPSNNYVTIEANNLEDNLSLLITNNLGQIIERRKITNYKTQIDRSNKFEAGTYKFTFIKENGESISKNIVLF